MSSYVLMRVLESTPQRYDRGIRLLTRGRIDEVYERLAEVAASPGARVLDVGCGTGGVSLACAARGADVVGIDRDAGMLEVAAAKPVSAAAGGRVEWVELGAAEIEDRFEPGSFDAAVSCLAFSEMSPEEQAYVLRTVRSRLRPGGVLAVADEARPESAGARLRHRLARLPAVVTTWVMTQTTTRAVEHLADTVRRAGFDDVDETRLWSGDFVIVTARAPAPRESSPESPRGSSS